MWQIFSPSFARKEKIQSLENKEKGLFLILSVKMKIPFSEMNVTDGKVTCSWMLRIFLFVAYLGM